MADRLAQEPGEIPSLGQKRVVAVTAVQMAVRRVPAGLGPTRRALPDELRRVELVAFDPELRALTQEVAAATHALIAGGHTPRMDYDKKRCDACSLIEICRPRTTGAARSAAAWLDAQLDA